MRRLFVSAAILASLAAPPAAWARIPPPETIFKAWDKNADGFLSLEEWTKAGRKERGFVFTDTDKDGKVTLEELKVAMAKAKALKGQ